MKKINYTLGIIAYAFLAVGTVLSFINYDLSVYTNISLMCACLFALLFIHRGHKVIKHNMLLLSKEDPQ